MFGNLQHGTEHLWISIISFWMLLGFQPLSVPRPHVLAGLQILRASHDNLAETHLMSAKVLILTQYKVVEDGFCLWNVLRFNQSLSISYLHPRNCFTFGGCQALRGLYISRPLTITNLMLAILENTTICHDSKVATNSWNNLHKQKLEHDWHCASDLIDLHFGWFYLWGFLVKQ